MTGKAIVGKAATASCVLAALALAALAPAARAPAAHAGTLRDWKSGVFAGYGPFADEQFAIWRGAPVQTATDYLEAADWHAIENPSWDILAWRQAPSIQPVFSVPMWPNTGGSLAAAAAGHYNAYFAALARRLVAGGLGSAIIRLGWEFNASWYPWSAQTARRASQYAEAWRQIVGTIKHVRGERFGFDWSMTIDGGGVDPARAYPGNSYVTSIGMDVYDWNQSAANHQNPASVGPSRRWNAIVSERYGLAWQARFAAAHHKPVSFPEWAVVYDPLDPAAGGGDDPTFVQNMYDWFASHDTAFEDYFDVDADAVDYGLTTGNGQFAQSTALYKSLYSGSTYSP
jgi:Glycosyl hydrolase family 26